MNPWLSKKQPLPSSSAFCSLMRLSELEMPSPNEQIAVVAVYALQVLFS